MALQLSSQAPAVIARRLAEIRSGKLPTETKPQGPILIRGTEGMAVQLASCCRPIPGDEIVGSMKKGQGLVVHAADCRQAVRSRSIATASPTTSRRPCSPIRWSRFAARKWWACRPPNGDTPSSRPAR